MRDNDVAYTADPFIPASSDGRFFGGSPGPDGRTGATFLPRSETKRPRVFANRVFRKRRPSAFVPPGDTEKPNPTSFIDVTEAFAAFAESWSRRLRVQRRRSSADEGKTFFLVCFGNRRREEYAKRFFFFFPLLLLEFVARIDGRSRQVSSARIDRVRRVPFHGGRASE